jgi:succinyl-CoA synthetase beta subunit
MNIHEYQAKELFEKIRRRHPAGESRLDGGGSW